MICMLLIFMVSLDFANFFCFPLDFKNAMDSADSIDLISSTPSRISSSDILANIESVAVPTPLLAVNVCVFMVCVFA